MKSVNEWFKVGASRQTMFMSAWHHVPPAVGGYRPLTRGGPAKIGVFRAGIVSEERSWDIRLGISRPAKWMAVGTGWLEQIGRPEVVSLGGRTVAGRRPKARSPLPRRWRPGPTSARTLPLDAPGIHDRNAMLPLLVARRRGTDSCGFGGM